MIDLCLLEMIVFKCYQLSDISEMLIDRSGDFVFDCIEMMISHQSEEHRKRFDYLQNE
jgi:hypothetical protein